MSKELMFTVVCIEEYKNYKNMTGKEVLNLFNKYSICEYIKEFYDALHVEAKQYIIDDIDSFIELKKRAKV